MASVTPDLHYLCNPHLHGLLLTYQPQKDERLSQTGWLTYSGQCSHKVVTCPAVQDGESSPVKTDILPTVLCC